MVCSAGRLKIAAVEEQWKQSLPFQIGRKGYAWKGRKGSGPVAEEVY